MKKIALYIFCAVLTVLCSCSGKDASELLKSVPKDTGVLMVANLGELNEKLTEGSNGNIDVSKIFNSLNDNQGMMKNISVTLSPESGVDFTLPFVAFERNNASVVTFYIKDRSKLIKNFEQKANIKLTESKGIYSNSENTVFISGNQGWISSDYPTISANDIALFNALKEDDSVLSLERVGKMADEKEDISVLLSLAYASTLQNIPPQGALILNMLFETPRFIEATVNFDKGKLDGSLAVLNEKGKVANCVLKPAKIDINALKSFPGKGSLFFALGTDSKAMEQIAEQLRTIPMMPADLLEGLKNLDGNFVVSSNANYMNPSVTAQISLKSAVDAQAWQSLLDMFGLGSGVNMTTQGNSIIFSMGSDPQGTSIDQVYNLFDGACFGVVALPGIFKSNMDSDTAQVLQGFSVMGKAKGDQLEIHYTLNTTPGKNSLLSLIELKQ